MLNLFHTKNRRIIFAKTGGHMAKKASFGLGALIGAVAGVVTGAVGVFLSDEDNRKKVVSEARKIERVVEKDLRKAKSKVKKVAKKAKKKAVKRRK
jgi:hypothetical protein